MRLKFDFAELKEMLGYILENALARELRIQQNMLCFWSSRGAAQWQVLIRSGDEPEGFTC